MRVNNLRFIDCRGTFGRTIGRLHRLLTKHTSEEGVLRAMEAGAKAFIRKPLTVKDLSEKIEPLRVERLDPAKS